MTPSALAHAIGITEGAIRQMETGQTKSASFIVGLKIGTVLGVSAWYLATGEERADRNDDLETAGLRVLVDDLRRRVADIEALLNGLSQSGQRCP